MPRWSQVHFISHVEVLVRSKWARQTAALFTLLFVMSVAALAQGSPFDSGFTAIQSLFTGTIAKVASLVAIVIGGYGFAHGEPGAKKGARWPWKESAALNDHINLYGFWSETSLTRSHRGH